MHVAQERVSSKQIVELRERFERWATTHGYNLASELSPFQRGDRRSVYVNPSVELAWQAVESVGRSPVETSTEPLCARSSNERLSDEGLANLLAWALADPKMLLIPETFRHIPDVIRELQDRRRSASSSDETKSNERLSAMRDRMLADEDLDPRQFDRRAVRIAHEAHEDRIELWRLLYSESTENASRNEPADDTESASVDWSATKR